MKLVGLELLAQVFQPIPDESKAGRWIQLSGSCREKLEGSGRWRDTVRSRMSYQTVNPAFSLQMVSWMLGVVLELR